MSEPTLEDRLFEAARNGEVEALAALLDRNPDRLYARTAPYEWTLLHLAAHYGRLAVVELLLKRGLDVNTREKGDDTYAMHWAAAAGHLEVVRRLADAGGDVVGHGDDHQLEVIGWATCWDGCDDPPHRAVAEFLISRGARHHIFSAIAMNLAEEVRRIVAADPAALRRRQSRNEGYRQPLHFAVRMSRPDMVALLLELGADPLATDADGFPAAAYASEPGVDRAVMEMLRDRGPLDLFTALALGETESAEKLWREKPAGVLSGAMRAGALHLMAKRNDLGAVQWLLDHGADPNALWKHWDAEVTPLHLATMQGHVEVVRLLLAAGADPGIHDSKHDSNAIGWAEYLGQQEVFRILTAHAKK